MKGRAIAAYCSEKVKGCLNSGFTPLICMLLLLLLHQFTEAITGAWVFRLFELALCILGIVVSFRTHTSWLKVVTVGVLAISLCTSSIHFVHDVNDKGGSTPSNIITRISDTDTSGLDRGKSTPSNWISVKNDCPTCLGIGGCPAFCLHGEKICPGFHCSFGRCTECGGDGENESYDYAKHDVKRSRCSYCNNGKCKTCNGTGRVQCSTCHGTGRCPTCGK